MPSQDDTAVWREDARRQHRPFGVYAVLHCWLKGLDGVIFKKDQLLRVLGFSKVIRRRRVEWLKEDLREFFPHQQDIWWADKADRDGQLNSFCSLWVSRRAFPQEIWSGSLADEARLVKIGSDGPRIAVFEMWPEAPPSESPSRLATELFASEGNYDERVLATYLALLCRGLISPRSLVPREPSLDDLDWFMPGPLGSGGP